MTTTLLLCIYMIQKYNLCINRANETSSLKIVSQASWMNRVMVGQNWWQRNKKSLKISKRWNILMDH